LIWLVATLLRKTVYNLRQLLDRDLLTAV